MLIPYPKPDSVSEHETTFEGVPLAFDSHIPGFAFDAALLDRRLTSADFAPARHDPVARRANAAGAPAVAIAHRMDRERHRGGAPEGCADRESNRGPAPHEHPDARAQARARRHDVQRSARGATAKARLRYVANDGIPLGEIAFLLGFSTRRVSPRVQAVDRHDAARLPPRTARARQAEPGS